MKFDYSDAAEWQRILLTRAVKAGGAQTLAQLAEATGIARAVAGQRLHELVFWARVKQDYRWNEEKKASERVFLPPSA